LLEVASLSGNTWLWTSVEIPVGETIFVWFPIVKQPLQGRGMSRLEFLKWRKIPQFLPQQGLQLENGNRISQRASSLGMRPGTHRNFISGNQGAPPGA